LIKGSKDSDSSLVSNENFSEILWPSGWALGQVICAKRAQKATSLMTSLTKNPQPSTKKFFFKCRLEDLLNLKGLNREVFNLSSAISEVAMALIRQLKGRFLGMIYS